MSSQSRWLPPLPESFRIPELEPDAIELNANPNAVTPSLTMRKAYDQREWRIYRWIYCRLTEQVDAQIARILDALKRSGLDDETLIVFTSDHGDMDACHRLASKGSFYEQSVRVPFLIRSTKLAPRGLVDSHLVSTGLDLLPTLCDFAGAPTPTTLLGRSLRPLVEGEGVDVWRDYVVTENHTGRMLRSPQYKYCVYREGELRGSLVDLRQDPGEMNNLATSAEHLQVLSAHRMYLQDWINASEDKEAQPFAF